MLSKSEKKRLHEKYGNDNEIRQFRIITSVGAQSL